MSGGRSDRGQPSTRPRSPRRGAAQRRLTVPLLAFTLLACEAPTAARPDPAFAPTSQSSGVLYRWRSGQRVRVWVDDDATLGPDLGRAVRAALAVWNAQPRFAEFELALVSNPAEANIVVFDRLQPLPVRPGRCAFDPRGAVGYTYFCGDGAQAERLALASGSPGNASVVIRVDRSLVTDQDGLDAIAAHEFGHALGIGAHSGDAGDLMFGLPRVRVPSARDARTLHYVLGAPPDLLL
jgi:predicted Zn-dependent protease